MFSRGWVRRALACSLHSEHGGAGLAEDSGDRTSRFVTQQGWYPADLNCGPHEMMELAFSPRSGVVAAPCGDMRILIRIHSAPPFPVVEDGCGGDMLPPHLSTIGSSLHRRVVYFNPRCGRRKDLSPAFALGCFPAEAVGSVMSRSVVSPAAQ